MDAVTSENELLQASLAGDKEAFGCIVQRYQALICALTYSATGDVGRSEELAQETFIRAWKKLRQLESPARFRAWLCTIARNLTYSSGRKIGRDVTHSAGPLEAAAAIPAATPRPDEAAAAQERQDMVWDAVGRIDPKYREPLVLFYRRGQSVNEVASDLDLPEDTVRQRLHRGRQLIKAEVSSLVEETLIRSGPGKAFAVGVVAALPAMVTPPASAAVVGAAAKGAPAAKTLVEAGLVGAILGPILGLLGGLFGAWFSFKDPDSPRQQRFRTRLFVVWCLLLLILLGLPLVLFYAGMIPVWIVGICLVTYVVSLTALIVWAKVGQRRLHTEEQGEPTSKRINRESLYGGVGGGIFGATGWLLVQAGLAHNWLVFIAIIACDVVLFLSITKLWIRRFER